MLKLSLVFFLFMALIAIFYSFVRKNAVLAGKVLLYGIPLAVVTTAALGFIVVVF